MVEKIEEIRRMVSKNGEEFKDEGKWSQWLEDREFSCALCIVSEKEGESSDIQVENEEAVYYRGQDRYTLGIPVHIDKG